MSETAECRYCRMELRGKPFCLGGRAFHPMTGEECKKNHYGGFVCSSQCDRHASLDLESSMPGAGEATRLSCYAQESFNNNWRDGESK